MTPSKIYADRDLYEIFAKVVTKDERAYSSADVSEALRIRRLGLNIDAIDYLIKEDADKLKKILATVRYAEEVAKKTNEVPKLCDL